MDRQLLLLEALCEKLGFDVEFDPGMEIPTGQVLTPPHYRLINKDEPCVKLPITGDVWSAMTEYVIDHMADIEADVNDFGKLQPVLDYFNRNS